MIVSKFPILTSFAVGMCACGPEALVLSLFNLLDVHAKEAVALTGVAL